MTTLEHEENSKFRKLAGPLAVSLQFSRRLDCLFSIAVMSVFSLVVFVCDQCISQGCIRQRFSKFTAPSEHHSHLSPTLWDSRWFVLFKNDPLSPAVMVCCHGICSTSKLIVNVLCAEVLFIDRESKNWIFFSDECPFSSGHTRRGHSRPKWESWLSGAGLSNTSGGAAGPSWWIPSSLPDRTIPLVSCRGHSDVHPPAAAGRKHVYPDMHQHVSSPYLNLNLTFALLQTSSPRSYIPLLSLPYINQLVSNSADVCSRADCRGEHFSWAEARSHHSRGWGDLQLVSPACVCFSSCWTRNWFVLSADCCPSFAPNPLRGLEMENSLTLIRVFLRASSRRFCCIAYKREPVNEPLLRARERVPQQMNLTLRPDSRAGRRKHKVLTQPIMGALVA